MNKHQIMQKIAENIGMSYAIPEHEKKISKDIVKNFKMAIEMIERNKDYLEKMYTPFKSSKSDLTFEQINNYRAAIYRFQKSIKERYNNLNLKCFLILTNMKIFTDVNFTELSDALDTGVKNLQKTVEEFLKVLDDISIQNFKNTCINSIENIFKESNQLKTLVEDRIIKHINDNVLNNDWKSQFQKLVENKTDVSPLESLYQEQQKRQI